MFVTNVAFNNNNLKKNTVCSDVNPTSGSDVKSTMISNQNATPTLQPNP